jgi:hypothetical protein
MIGTDYGGANGGFPPIAACPGRRRQSGNIRKAELHGCEAHGIGRRKMKIKRFLG